MLSSLVAVETRPKWRNLLFLHLVHSGQLGIFKERRS